MNFMGFMNEIHIIYINMYYIFLTVIHNSMIKLKLLEGDYLWLLKIKRY